MKKNLRKVFEADRKMELRVRLAAKRADRMPERSLVRKYAVITPDREVVSRIIKRVRQL
jgi:hypothetical protein